MMEERREKCGVHVLKQKKNRNLLLFLKFDSFSLEICLKFFKQKTK